MSLDFQSLIPSSQEIASNIKQDPINELYDDSESKWLWNGQLIDSIPAAHDSFVYLFTNKITHKQYIGFKTSTSTKTISVNGKKKRTKVCSDWKDYWSSSSEVLKDVEKYGTGNWIREIIALTCNKSVGKYFEAYYQFTRGVLTNNHDRYYNGIINLRLNHNTIAKKWNKVEFATVILGDRLVEASN